MLAHTNKAPDAAGRPVYAGVADIVQDMDCCYLLYVVSEPGAAEKIVTFENFKRRGDVAQQMAFGYSAADGRSYQQLLDSVRSIAGHDAGAIAKAAEIRAEEDIIRIVRGCIEEGITQRTELARAVRQRAGCSRQTALDVIDRYSGPDPSKHQWSFRVVERGAKVYGLLARAELASNPMPDTTQN